MVRSGIVLLLVLAAYWLTLSGYFDHPVLFVTGGLSVILVVWLCARMKILDWETVPYVYAKSVVYFAWLFKEIVKANFAVVKAVMSPDMRISPKMLNVKMDHETDLGRTMLANSITLTPGTISVEVEEGNILVHALLEELTDPLGFQEMGERSGWAINDPWLVKKLTEEAK